MYILALVPSSSQTLKANFKRTNDPNGQYWINNPVTALALCVDNGEQKIVGVTAVNGVIVIADGYSWDEGSNTYTFDSYQER